MNRAQLIKAVQARMSDIMPGNQIEVASHPFVDALLNDCVEGFYMILPNNLLPRVDFSSGTVQAVPSTEVDVYRIQLPEDFVRLIAFRCTAWNRAVTKSVVEGSPQHQMQFLKHTFGGNTRPVVTIVADPDMGRSVEYYHSTSTTDTSILEASCAVKDEIEDMPDILIDGFAWYVASIALQTMEELDASKAAMLRVEQFIENHK